MPETPERVSGFFLPATDAFIVELYPYLDYLVLPMKTRPVVVSIVGARPQFIKLAPLAREFSKQFRHLVIHTGQHFDADMSDIFFRQLRLPRPYVNLGVGGGTHGHMTGRMLARIEKVLLTEKPDFALVYGDTNSTLAGALAAAKLSIPVGHIEAGLRSFVGDMPEEINRKLTDHVSTVLFCPTPTAVKNVEAENVTGQIVYSGDVMYEQLDRFREKIKSNSRSLNRLSLQKKEFLFLTVHRAAMVDLERNLYALVSILETQ